MKEARMDFKGRRVNAHNTWPVSAEFRAEVEFRERLGTSLGSAIFRPAQLADNADAVYQKCVAHFIDGLDALPQRPDYYFDHCFRVLDVLKKTIAHPDKGLSGVAANLPAKLLILDQNSWTQIANSFGAAIPRVTIDFLAKRLLSTYRTNDEELKLLRKRAIDILGAQFYEEFCKKFTNDNLGNPLPSFTKNIPAAGSLMRLYLSGQPGTRGKKASHPVLDVRLNPISAPKRLQVLLSLLLFTVRNERAHGAILSPFRSSKAKLERYESYYYIMLTAYIFALGSLAYQFPNKSICSSDILMILQSNIALQANIFTIKPPPSPEVSTLDPAIVLNQ